MENYFIGLLGIVEIIEELWNCGIHLHHGWLCEKNCEKCMKWKKMKARVRRIKKGERYLG